MLYTKRSTVERVVINGRKFHNGKQVDGVSKDDSLPEKLDHSFGTLRGYSVWLYIRVLIEIIILSHFLDSITEFNIFS